jgi:HEPN domain-containing protein
MDPVLFLAAVRARLVRVLVVEGLARILALGLTLAVAAVAADYVWQLPGGVRTLLLVLVLAACGLVGWVRLGRPFRRDLGDRDLARFVERRALQLDGRLLTAVEGIALGEADQRVLSEQLQQLDLRQLIPARRTPKQVLVTALAVVAVGLAGVLAPDIASDGARRLLLPWGEGEWRRHVVLSLALEQPVVPADAALLLTITRHHPDAGYSAPVVVTWKSGRSEEQRQLGGLTGQTWNTSIAAAPGTYAITVTSGDAAPVTVTGRIVTRPVVGRVRALLVPPAYTGLPQQQSETLAAAVIPGTRIDFSVGFHAETGRDIVKAEAAFAGTAIPLSASDDRWSGSVTPKAAGALTLSAADQDGIGIAGDVRFPVTITPDRPPVVSLSGPQPRESVTVRAVVDLTIAASDDFGLGELTVRSRVQHQEPAAGAAAPATPAAPPATATATAEGELLERCTGVLGQLSVTRATTVEVGRFAAEGEQLVLTARAADRNDVSGPGIGESEPLALRVVPEDVLRQEFDRLLGEARERVVQGRDELAAAAEDRARRVRSATQAATKGEYLVAQVLRRWDQNRFPAEGILPARKARTLLVETALPKLAEAAGATDDAPRVAAEAALTEAERLLGSILQEGDLTRLLTSLIARQTALNTEARGFVRAFLTKTLDPAGKLLQQNLAGRQRELAEQVLEVERRLLAKEGSSWTKAQDLVRSEAPGDRLRQASQDLATTDRRSKAVEGEQAALVTLQKLLDALRGGDAAKDLSAQVGDLAKDQERLAHDLEQGTAPGSLAARQKELAERAQALAREAQAKDPAAAKLLQGATAAQQSAESGMKAGNAPAATRDANAAANLLREAQAKLGGEPPKKPDEEKKPEQINVLALLKALRSQQAALVTDATVLDQTLGEKQPDFATTRQLQTLARTQSDVQLRLSEEAIKPLEKNPIALLALERVDQAMQAAAKHLAKPALGSKGLRLTRNALAEISRLIEVAEDLPKPKQSEGQKPPANGSGGPSQSPPFPPQAELALLAAMQQELAVLTAAGHPTDLAAGQQKLLELVEGLAQTVRPSTRPAELLERTRRAMASATFQLGHQDRGALTRNEQQAAEAALRRLLAEAESNSGSSGQSSPQAQNQPPSGGNKPPSPSDGQGNPQSGQPQASGNSNGGRGSTAALPVQATTTAGNLMQLPPAIRDQLLQAREQQFTPGQLQIYQRYLELLEEGK